MTTYNNAAKGIGTIFKGVGSLGGNRIAAVLVWLTSAYMTSTLIETLRVPGQSVGGVLDFVVLNLYGSSFLAAIIIQGIITIGEQPLWRGGRWTIVSVSMMLIDTLINAGSLWPFLRNADDTLIWSYALDFFSLDPSYSTFIAGIITLFCGVVLAALPEYLWRERKQ
jgi:hypothetical protein